MPKANQPPETTLERLQSLNLITRLSSDINAQIGINDKTLTEFIISLAEKEIKSAYKKKFKQSSSNVTTVIFDVDSDVELAQSLRTILSANGADLPLGFVSRLLMTVYDMSPRIKRFKDSLEKKRMEKMTKATSNGDGNNDVGNEGSMSNKPLLSSYKHDDRKLEMGKSFPGLAVPNATHAVPLEGFHELSNVELEDAKKQAVKETSKRKQSNLPSWMTKEDSEDRNWKSNEVKRMRPSMDLEIHGIYSGRITNITNFGVFVEITDISPPKEGLVHISQLSKHRLNHPRDAGLKPMQQVYVKVISFSTNDGRGKLMLSIKDVDQNSGEDLMPHRAKVTIERDNNQNRSKIISSHQSGSASTAVVHPGLDVAALKRREEEEEATRQSKLSGIDNTYIAPHARKTASEGGNRRTKQLTEQELFEARQLINSGVLAVDQYPTFDAEGGMGMMAVEETEEEWEVDLADVEPAFLRGQTRRSGKDLSPVRIVKNPDGSMQRAAMQQSSMAKERRELRQAQANSLMDSIPKDLSRPWEDPLPEAGERHFAQELRSINMSTFDGAPEWKQKAQSKTLSYGIISNKSIKEQREGLPVYRLKSELLRAISENQVLVVIGETGSG